MVDVTNNMGLFVAIVQVDGPKEEKRNVELKVHAPVKKGATNELQKMSGFEYRYVELLESIMTVFQISVPVCSSVPVELGVGFTFPSYQ